MSLVLREREREIKWMHAATSERDGINHFFFYLASINNINTNTDTITIVASAPSWHHHHHHHHHHHQPWRRQQCLILLLCQLLAPLA